MRGTAERVASKEPAFDLQVYFKMALGWIIPQITGM